MTKNKSRQVFKILSMTAVYGLLLFSCQKMSSSNESILNTQESDLNEHETEDVNIATGQLNDNKKIQALEDSEIAELDQRFPTTNQFGIDANIAFLRTQLKHLDMTRIYLVAKYLTYIQLTPEKSNYKDTVTRLLNSSLEFIFCTSLDDVACLEKSSISKTVPASRKDTSATLSKPIQAGKKLDIEYYFTQAWANNMSAKSKNFVNPTFSVADFLAEKISDKNNQSIFMAAYGIDDLKGSMASVFQAVESQLKQQKSVKAVVDIIDSPQPGNFIRDYDIQRTDIGKYLVKTLEKPMDYSYSKPTDARSWAFGAPLWTEQFLKDIQFLLFSNTVGPLLVKVSSVDIKSAILKNMLTLDPQLLGNLSAVLNDIAMIGSAYNLTNYLEKISRITYQYDGTNQLVNLLNANISSNEQANARIEYPFAGIMHNKFVITETAKGVKSVWTGTANISQTCMGNENNANMSIFIKNDFIAQSFKEEFNEMFDPYIDSKRPQTLLTGAFHSNKRPNSNRFFTFLDQTEVRVHFSPTDDAEHRVLLPLIYSAKKGDLLRISMFGSAGYEFVRAFQSALARGVNIKIALDKLSGMGAESWIKSNDANLYQPNIYSTVNLGVLEIRKNAWPGLNHHKTASLARSTSDSKTRGETIVIGSQNWSKSGNDLNDENVVTISNKIKELDVITAFNKEFDDNIWKWSSIIDPMDLKNSKSLTGEMAEQ